MIKVLEFYFKVGSLYQTLQQKLFESDIIKTTVILVKYGISSSYYIQLFLIVRHMKEASC